MTETRFEEMQVAAPSMEELSAEFEKIRTDCESASSKEEFLGAVRSWDVVRRRVDSWHSLTHLRFNQDTQNEEFRKAREYADEVWPKITDLEVGIKRKLLDSPWRRDLESEFGSQFLDLWDTSIRSFDPVIQEDLVKESKLEAEYVELLASAKLDFQGETYNLSDIRKFAENPDRNVRHDSAEVMWKWFQAHGSELDRIYGDMVKLRTEMAAKLNLPSFTELGYLRMSRIDYDRADVEKFRQQVRELVVPLCAELRESQRGRLGLETLRSWDEPVHDNSGNPAPKGDHDWMLVQAQTMFDELGGGLGEFFRMMNDNQLLDLKSREGKAGGGFCTSFPSFGVPFIFANFNGTKGDVEVFTHEAGHAFQCWKSQSLPLYDYLWPTTESCEIHSMALEFLTWPQMDLFFGQEADRFRRIHLIESLLFLPYGVAVDHFQHLVYAKPDATAAERHEMWQEMERTYLPWRNYGDLERPSAGGLWQSQRHIYLCPFYYIDYTLALTCALQFWVKAEEDRDAAMKDYVELCERGGVAPFRELAKSAGLVPPFEEGCLAKVVEQARAFLD